MKTKHVIILGVLAVLAVAYVISIVPNFRHRSEWKRTATALQTLPQDRVHAAVQAFKRDRKPTESAVPLRELVAGGYLQAEDARGLADRGASVSLTADETPPQTVWIRVRATDGSDIVLMADGSVHKVIRQ
jgi:hypothetical protein